MTTFPFSQLPADAKARATEYGQDWNTVFVLHVCDDFYRVAIENNSYPKRAEKLLAKGWTALDFSS
jgi:hypothetical protein